jgi:alcohol dehydrogenase class IV
VEQLLAQLPVPHRLRELTLERAELGAIAEAAMSDWFISRNARPVNDVSALLGVLDAAW